MDEGRCFVVEAMQTVRRLIDMCIVLRHELPPHFGWDDIFRRGIVVGRSGIRHDGIEYWLREGSEREEGILWGKKHTERVQKGLEKNAWRNLRVIERAIEGDGSMSSRTSPQNSQRGGPQKFSARALGIFRVTCIPSMVS